MPYLNLRIAASVSPEVSGKAATLLTNLTASVLGKKRELTAVDVEFAKPSAWFIGGKPVDEVGVASFYLNIKVTEGTNTKNDKAEYVKQVFAGMSEILGPLASASYIVIHEVHADAWGYEGQTQEYRYIKGKAL